METQTTQNSTYHITILIVFQRCSVVYACVCVISQSLWIYEEKKNPTVCVMARGTVSVEIC